MKDIKLLKQLYKIQSKSGFEEVMIAFLADYLLSIENVSFTIIDKNIYVTKGEAESYPTIVAHMD